MKFKEFLSELAIPHLPEMGVENTICNSVNSNLKKELDDVILSPQIGFLKIRKVLRGYGYDLPTLYDIEPEGDEIVLDVTNTSLMLYVLYYQSDDGNYEFYAELNDIDGIEEIITKDQDLEEE